jgi:hypothetical protein
MLCKICKNEIPFYAAFCPECGADLLTQNVAPSQTTPEAAANEKQTPEQSKKTLFSCILGILLVIALVFSLLAFDVFSKPKADQNTYTGVLLILQNGIRNNSSTEISKAFPTKYMEDCSAFIPSTSTYVGPGYDIDPTYKITGVFEAGETELDELQQALSKNFGFNSASCQIERAVLADIYITYGGRFPVYFNESDKYAKTQFLFVQINGMWYTLMEANLYLGLNW